ncbi:MAG: DMT family transporter, partial [Pseudomonadota bacterium]
STVTLSISVFAALGLLGSVSLVLWNTVAPSLPPGTPSFIALGWQTPSSMATALTLFHALCASLAIGLLTFAYQRGLPTRVAVLEYTLLVFAAIFAWLFWQELPTKLAVAGMLLIALSGVIITYQAPEPPTQ